MNKVLVTGGSGFVGREVVRQLKERGCFVRVMARARHDNPAVDDWFMADLVQPATLNGVGAGMDTLIHLAGYAHTTSKPYPEEVEKHRRINLQGSCDLVAEAIRNGVERIVYVSSVKAGGESSTDCLDENSERLPQEPYGQLKREAEQQVLARCEKAGVHVAVIRPALVYGPGVKGNIAAMLQAIDRGRFPPLPDTHNRRSMVDVRDLAHALLLAAETPAANGRRYIITDNEAYSTRRMYEALITGLGQALPKWNVPGWLFRALGKAGDLLEVTTGRAMPVNSTLVNRLLESACYRSVRAEQELGFVPRYRFEDAVPGMVSYEAE